MSQMEEQAETLLAALDKLPPYRGLSYRGFVEQLPSRPQRASVSTVLVATSKDPRVATGGFTTPGVYAIIGNRGRELTSLSRHPAEREIVFRPGSMFLPIERFDVDGLEVATVEELDPDVDKSAPPSFTLEELRAQVRQNIAEARAKPALAGVTPGKFVGGLS
ncbi:hypothetical protein [Nocardioides sp. Iso805N]|uniref:hypothetical protein n=1 Tax=Nocardioides sp. Iso805N TaxID=1283287 RepID=UPI0003641579|nr:hypothetical protein [Nocardioides sp. Iso805N]